MPNFMRQLFFSGLVGLLLVSLPARVAAAELVIVGTGDGMEMLRAVAIAYLGEKTGSPVSIPPSIGSGGAIAAVGADREMVGRVARPLTPKETALGLTYQPIMKIPSAFIVHKDVKVASLTSAQLIGIFAGTIASWKEVGGPDIRIKVVRREDSDSTLQVLRASMPGWSDLVLTPRSKMAVTTQEAIASVQENAGAIGFAPYSRQLAKDVSVLRVNNLHPTDNEYLSAVIVALIFKPERLDESAKKFLNFLNGERAKSILTQLGAQMAKP